MSIPLSLLTSPLNRHVQLLHSTAIATYIYAGEKAQAASPAASDSL